MGAGGEGAVAAATLVADDANLSDMVFANAAEQPDLVSFEHKVGGEWRQVTAKDFAEQVRALAGGLMATGVQPGDRVALLSGTRYEWTLVDYAIWTAGAVTVPIYETSSAEQVEWILSDSGAVALLVETGHHEKTFASLAGRLPAVRACYRITDGGLDGLIDGGRGVSQDDIETRRRQAGADDLATLIYTSGTTGRPKGCELTHRAFLFEAQSTTAVLGELFTPEDSTLLFLPLAHVFARVIQIGCVRNRVRMGHTSDVKNLMADLAAFRPTFLLSVPRVFEKVYNTAKHRAHADGKGAIFDRAERVAIAYSEALDRGGPGLLLRLQHALFDRLVYTRLRDALGGRVRYAVSGGAPLGARLGHFFRGIGLTVLEGYGLTETTAAATVNLPSSTRVGTVGRAVPGVALRIAEDGEILIRGDNVFRGYWHNERATSEALTDGWFRTGDIGRLDDDGFLTITGRKKELIVTAGGKNVAPSVLEDRIRRHRLISQCLVVGDQRPFVAALVTVDEEALSSWKAEHGKPAEASVADLGSDEELRREIQAAIDEANEAVSRAEGIRAFRIIPRDFSEEDGTLTPTMKVKRAVVVERYADDIEALYRR
jgi:long-chain acyl-CoA synthetase